MRTALNRTSGIAIWLGRRALITWLALTLGCGGKGSGGTNLLPGKTIQDAGGGSAHDAKPDAVVVVVPPGPTADASTIVVDAKAPEREAAPKATLVSIALTPSATTISPAGKVTLKVTGTYSDNTTLELTGSAVLTSSNPKVATVAGNVVAAVSAGTATVAAVLDGLIAFSTITVGQAMVVSISLSPTSLNVYAGSFFQFNSITADALMSDGSHKDVTAEATWTSADATIAVVSSSAKVQGVNPGSTRITATVGQIQASAAVQVNGPKLTHLTLQVVPPVARPGDVITANLLGTYDNGQQIPITATSFESSNPAVLKLSSSGNGIAASVGKTTITAKLGDQAVGTVEVVVTNATLQRIEVVPAKVTIDYPNRGHLIANGVYSDQARYDFTRLVAWSTENNNILNTDEGNGVVIPNMLGIAIVRADYNGLSGSAEVTVAAGTPLSLTIAGDPGSVPNYGNFALTAYLNYADGSALDATSAATWVSDDPTVAAVVTAADYAGTFVAGHAGSTKVRAKFGNMTTTDLTVKVTTVALLAIDLSAAHIGVSIGSPYDRMQATGTFSDSSQFYVSRSVLWKTGNTAIATISNDPSTVGVVTGIASGTTSLTATLSGVSATTTVTVN